jgi:hypothetical protein
VTEAAQLAALAEVHELLGDAGIPYWLFGGWAVDFHVGAVTRPHDDVDVAVWEADLPRIVPLFEAEGWRHAPYEDEDGGTGYERGGVRVELTYLFAGAEGRVFIPLRTGPALWSESSPPGEERELLGVRARVLGARLLATGKASPRADADDAAKDRADFEQLSRFRRSS